MNLSSHKHITIFLSLIFSLFFIFFWIVDIPLKHSNSELLLTAVAQDNITLAKKLLEIALTLDKIGITPLLLITYTGNIEMAKLLLKYGADLKMYNKDRITALFGAIYNNNRVIAEFFLKNGANRAKKVLTPLKVARAHKQAKMIKLLLEYNAH